jgi:ABC-type polar amino acid transport system ATPase subunit
VERVPHLTVLENVTLAPRKVLGMSKAQAEEIAVAQLTHVGLSDKLKVYPAACRGGSSSAWRSPGRSPCRPPTCCSTR